MDNPEKTSLSEAAEILELRKSAGFGILGRKRPNRSEDWSAMQIDNQSIIYGWSFFERAPLFWPFFWIDPKCPYTMSEMPDLISPLVAFA